MSVVSVVEGRESLSGNVIGTLYGKRFWYSLQNKTILPEITASGIEGAEEIKNQGDTVKVPICPVPVSVSVSGGEEFEYPEYKPEMRTFQVGRIRVNPFRMKKTDVAQMLSGYKGMAAEMTEQGSNEMARRIEAEMFQAWLADAGADCIGATAGQTGGVNLGTALAPLTTINSSTITKKITELRAVAEENNWNDQEQFLVVDPLYGSLLLNGNLANASWTGDSQSALLTGKLMQGEKVRKIAGFTIYASNQLYRSGGVVYWLYGCKSALGWVSQWQESEVLQKTGVLDRFYHQAILHDGWVLRPEMFGYLAVSATPAAES